MKRHLFTVGALLGLGLATSPHLRAEPVPLIHAHAHNDYMHARPLLDALDHGFCSVEADIHLVDGKLLVAHDRQNVKPDGTLQALYLEPLRKQIRKNNGKVYPQGPQFSVLIDLKTDWRTTYPALRDVLKEYADILTTFKSGVTQTNAVIAVISGSRSLTMFDGETMRYAAYDGELSIAGSTNSAALIPWVSANWSATFQWRGTGDLPTEEKQRLQQIVNQAHQNGRRVRFWGAPDTQPFWAEMVRNGVDLINTDDLEGLQNFLKAQSK
jgi:hypothetical protein